MRVMRGLTLVDWILLIAAALTLAALALPTWARAGRHEQLTLCRDNLKALHRAEAGAPKDPAALGMRFWTRLGLPEKLRCPFVPREIARPTDYLGPSQDPAGLEPDDPLGCDMPENHGEHGKMGGNVLYKSGEVRTLHPRPEGVVDDPWREISRKKCRP